MKSLFFAASFCIAAMVGTAHAAESCRYDQEVYALMETLRLYGGVDVSPDPLLPALGRSDAAPCSPSVNAQFKEFVATFTDEFGKKVDLTKVQDLYGWRIQTIRLRLVESQDAFSIHRYDFHPYIEGSAPWQLLFDTSIDEARDVAIHVLTEAYPHINRMEVLLREFRDLIGYRFAVEWLPVDSDTPERVYADMEKTAGDVIALIQRMPSEERACIKAHRARQVYLFLSPEGFGGYDERHPISQAVNTLRDQVFFVDDLEGIDKVQRDHDFRSLSIIAHQRTGSLRLIRRGIEFEYVCFTFEGGRWGNRPKDVFAYAYYDSTPREQVSIERRGRGCFGLDVPSGTSYVEIEFVDADWPYN